MQGMFKIIVMAGLLSTAVAAQASHDTNISLTKTTPNGVSITSNYTYQFNASNVGPTDETGVKVDDPLPPGISYVSDTCGGGVVGGVWSWSLGNLNHGNSAACTLTVTTTHPLFCPVVTNEAMLSTDSLYTNTASTTNGSASSAVTDGGFEQGVGGAWSESSTNFGTPLCDSSCPGGLGSHSGQIWAFFGGYISGLEIASLNQSVHLPAVASTLRFYVRLKVCNAHQGTNDFVRLTVDGSELWREDATSANCGEVSYRKIEVPLNGFANGSSHVVDFNASQTGDGDVSDFFIDDVSVVNATCGSGASDLIFKNGFD